MSDRGDKLLMERALRTAYSRMGHTSPNPPVGAVIVKDGAVVSSGGTREYGSDHAEVDAIGSAGVPLGGAELYVTLEPCCHFGKTPPCTEAIIRAGIRKVCTPLPDPNPLVAGKGIERLREAGIEVEIMDDMAPQSGDLLRPFKKYITHQKPFVLHKAALSLDGKIATVSGDSKWISSEHSRYVVHRLRSHVDAVIVGKNTLARDNPSLNVRMESFSEEVRSFFERTGFRLGGRYNFLMDMLLRGGEDRRESTPLRVIMGLPDTISPDMNVFLDENYIFFVEKNRREAFPERADYPLLRKLEDRGKIFFLEGAGWTERTNEALSELYRRGVLLAMLEGGGITAGSFFDAGAIDQFLYFIAPRIIGRGPSPVEGAGTRAVADSKGLRDVTSVLVGNDIMYTAYARTYGEL